MTFYLFHPQKQIVKCVSDLYNRMPTRLKKRLSSMLQNTRLFKGFLLAWRVNAQTTPWVWWPAPGMPSRLSLAQLFSLFFPLKKSENHNSRMVDGQAPTHTYSKISTYFWHTSCLQLIKTCFIFETRHCEALLFSHWWNIRAVNVSTHTSTRN